MFKKTIIILILLCSSLGLVGCGENVERRNLRDDINELISLYPERAEELEALKQNLYDNPHNVYQIAKRLTTLRQIYEGIYDGYIVIRIIDLTDEVIAFEDVLYRNQDTLLDLLIRDFNAEVNENLTLKRLGGSFYDPNYQLKAYQDNANIENLSTFPYRNGDLITIRNENKGNLSKTELMVDKVVYHFMRNRLNQYFGVAPSFNSYIVSAVRLLEENGYDASLKGTAASARYETYYQNKVYDTTSSNYLSSLFKDLLIMKALEMDTEGISGKILKRMNSFVNLQNHNALLSLGVGGVEQEIIQGLIDYITSYQPNQNDAEGVSLAMMALANYPGDANYQYNIQRFNHYLSERMSKDGINQDGSNCTSTSNAIIALLANGINPRGTDFQIEDVDLIKALLQYYQDGAFNWTKDSGTDLVFSTPQAWAALVTYKIYRDLGAKDLRLFKP